MDTRTTSADFYPGGKTPVTAGGGITSGEGEAYNGEQRVPITSIEGLPERFTEGDMKSKIDDICKVLRTGGLALAAILSFPVWGADGITVHGTRKDRIYNDGFVVTNVTADLKVLTTNDVCNIVTNKVAGGFSPWTATVDIPENDWLDESEKENFRNYTAKWRISWSPQTPDEDDLDAYWSFYPLGNLEGKDDKWFIPPPDMLGLDENATNILFIIAAEREPPWRWVCARTTRARQKPGNALGLATLKDIEGAVTVDKYSTNSVYFIDDDVPTMKLFTSYTRSPYWANRMSAIEIGDRNQVLKTFYAQVDGNLAVNTPANIRFMSTLDRNSAYDKGKSLTLQDYLDAFNPVLVPETLKMFQTNRSDFSVGDMRVHETLTVANKEDGNIFSVTEQEANFMNSLVVRPDVGPFLYYEGAKNDEGVVTNYYGFAKTNAEVEVNGNMHVSDSIGVSSNVFVWGNLIINGWDKIYVKPGKETDVNAYHGYRESIGAYFERLSAPLIAATNEYARGDKFIDLTGPVDVKALLEGGEGWNVIDINGWNPNSPQYAGKEGCHKMEFEVADKGNFRITTAGWGVNQGLKLQQWVIKLGAGASRFTRNKFLFDTTGHNGKTNIIDIGKYNFKNTGTYSGEFETIYSNIEPIERTEAVLRTETYEYENWIWDEELGDYILDPDEPYITETYEWWDEYTIDMVWELVPDTIWEFDFVRVGKTSLRVNVQRVYKTQPYSDPKN